MYDRIQGVLEKPVGEGTHIRIPWFQTPHVMDIRTRPRSVSSVTGTKGEHRGSIVNAVQLLTSQIWGDPFKVGLHLLSSFELSKWDAGAAGKL